MTFIDEIDIYVSSGNGGNGVISLNKNTLTKDGGNGGDGGNIYIVATTKKNELTTINFKKNYTAENGKNGGKNRKNGKNGADLHIEVPIGTLIYDNEEKKLLGELIHDKEKLLIIKGGGGGIGNTYISKKQLNLTKGQKGTIKFIHLEMYLLADIGLIGQPNVGKSSLLNICTNTRSKIANYNFTTINPQLGVLNTRSKKKIILADIPGILRNASEGKGLGFNFLKHITKNNILFHVISSKKMTRCNIIKDISIINKELIKFNSTIQKKQKWIVLNKIDLVNNINITKIKNSVLFNKYNYQSIFCISIKKKNGIKKLLFNIKEYIKKT